MKRLVPTLILAATLAAPLAAYAASQDTLTLTDGTRLHGQVVEETDDHVTLMDGGVQRKFSRSRVLQVAYNSSIGSEQAPAAKSYAPEPASQPTYDPAPVSSHMQPTGDPATTDYYNGVADHYQVPITQVVYVQQQGVPMEEVPVVFELAARARVAPGVVLGLRLGGLSWRDVGLHFGIGTDAFYVNVGAGAVTAPYQHLYNGFWHRPRRSWGGIVLSDDDITDCVNLQFVSGYWHRPVREVMGYRGGGERYHQVYERYAPVRRVEERHESMRIQVGERGEERRDGGSRIWYGHEGRGAHAERWGREDRGERGEREDRGGSWGHERR